uniref:AlNc14C173G8049 protein n=1 Tax=Albugo laibachii Nc14 TaxID=890382 RepID=F0WNM8_9STRA|nr:AlNc14C173G8049 [Albugo laibachii Nc14]|eukprot:CCA22919.1 AlNc14C173G8049 [Albugo laibachii Nc14]
MLTSMMEASDYGSYLFKLMIEVTKVRSFMALLEIKPDKCPLYYENPNIRKEMLEEARIQAEKPHEHEKANIETMELCKSKVEKAQRGIIGSEPWLKGSTELNTLMESTISEHLF